MAIELITVHTITATETAGCYMVVATITDDDAATYEATFAYNPTDPYGLGPIFGEWLAANPDFPITPYTPPTIEQKREGAFLARPDFRRNMLAIGVTTTKINAYLAGIEDPVTQDERTIYWEESGVFMRLDPFVTELGVSAGVTDAQLDTAFEIV